MSASFEDESYVQRAGVRCCVRVYERYSMAGGNRLSMTNPVFERADRQDVTGRIVPVYPLTAGISNHLISSLTHLAVEHCAARMPESLPPKVRLAHQLAQADVSYQNIHFPPPPRTWTRPGGGSP